jgi:sugar phosphate isomerase/epimerase
MTSPFRLGYCTNIHAGETLAEVIAAIGGPVTAVATKLGGEVEIGLRLGGAAARELRDARARAVLREALVRAGASVFTLNGFPYGQFHGTTVKEAVYRPDWSESARVEYTLDLVQALVAVAAHDVERPSISTVPGAFAPRGRMPEAVAAIARNLADVAAVLWGLCERGGAPMVLALEPEPCCMLETIAQTVAFFGTHVFAGTGLARFQERTRTSATQAEAALRSHVGVCLDACHAAVELEDPHGCVDALVRAGIAIAKVQVSAGLELVPTPDALARVRAFADPVYLHQVVAETATGVERYLDLDDALERGRDAKRWRVHFHVPVFAAELGTLASTQGFLAELLHHVRKTNASQQFEVETYTWDVLPAEHRALPLPDAIVRELTWTKSQLA